MTGRRYAGNSSSTALMRGEVQDQGVDAWGSQAAGLLCVGKSRQGVDAWRGPEAGR